jgi:hypothetical protein
METSSRNEGLAYAKNMLETSSSFSQVLGQVACYGLMVPL